MRAFVALLSGYLAWLCKVFQVTPSSIERDRLGRERRGNLPPPSGGVASY
jgi:hypothetical protein